MTHGTAFVQIAIVMGTTKTEKSGLKLLKRSSLSWLEQIFGPSTPETQAQKMCIFILLQS